MVRVARRINQTPTELNSGWEILTCDYTQRNNIKPNQTKIQVGRGLGSG